MKTVTMLLICIAFTTNAFSQVFFCTQKTNGSYDIYSLESRKKIATTSDSLGTILQKTGGILNPTPVVQGNQLLIPGTGFVPLPVVNPDHIVTADEVIVIRDSIAWMWNGSSWDSLNTETPYMIAFDAIMYQSERYVLVYQEYLGQKYVSCAKTDDPTFVGYGFVDDSVQDIFFIKGISYTETSNAVQLGDFVFPIQLLFLEAQTCAGNWCFYLENYFPVQTLDYLTHPKQIGLDEGPTYDTYEVEAVATPRASGNFTTALDVPNLGPADFVKTNYFLTLKQSENSVYLGSRQQRLFLHRVQYAGCGVQNASFNFDLGLVRYENGKIFSVDGRDDYLQSKMHLYDSLGQYIAAYPVTDSHDGQLIDSFTIAFDYRDSGIYYINPPIVINNNTGVRYKIPSDQLYPLVADSCVLSSGQVLFPSLGDIDHGNSVYMFWVETLQKYILLRSGRNLGLYPISYPLCAWQFEPTGAFMIDQQLTDLINSSPFGFGRDGGHDFQVEMEFSNDVSETFLLSQYDNVVCDDPAVGPSCGHTAYLKYVAGTGWEISDFKQFTAPPSTAMGNIDVFKSHTDDTCVVISAAGGISGSNVSTDPQVVVYDYSSREKIAHVIFSLPNFRVVAYQCNATSEKFEVPNFKFSTHEDLDSLYVVADSIPQGTWFWWLGSKQIAQSLSIAKSALVNDGGIAIFASGWYSEADTVPGAMSCERSRWISEPIWVSAGTTSSFVDVVVNGEIRIYPNPTLDQITITGAEKNSIVTVFSLTGQEIVRTTEKRISLQQYPAGVYFLNVTNTKVVKIIKL